MPDSDKTIANNSLKKNKTSKLIEVKLHLRGEVSAGLKWDAISSQQLVTQRILPQIKPFFVKGKFRCNYPLVHLCKGNTLVFIECFSQGDLRVNYTNN